MRRFLIVFVSESPKRSHCDEHVPINNWLKFARFLFDCMNMDSSSIGLRYSNNVCFIWMISFHRRWRVRMRSISLFNFKYSLQSRIVMCNCLKTWLISWICFCRVCSLIVEICSDCLTRTSCRCASKSKKYLIIVRISFSIVELFTEKLSIERVECFNDSSRWYNKLCDSTRNCFVNCRAVSIVSCNNVNACWWIWWIWQSWQYVCEHKSQK